MSRDDHEKRSRETVNNERITTIIQGKKTAINDPVRRTNSNFTIKELVIPNKTLNSFL